MTGKDRDVKPTFGEAARAGATRSVRHCIIGSIGFNLSGEHGNLIV